MDKIRDAIESVTLQLAIARYHSAASNGDRRGRSLAVAWADRELDGWRLDAFYAAVQVDASSGEAAELLQIGERCAEFRRCVRARIPLQS